jgi:hypothetical protein
MPDETKLSHEEFFRKAIPALRKVNTRTGKPYLGIHSVFSGVNDAFRKYFGKDADPIAAVNKLVEEGRLYTRPMKGGVMIYFPEDAVQVDKGKDALTKMGLEKPRRST